MMRCADTYKGIVRSALSLTLALLVSGASASVAAAPHAAITAFTSYCFKAGQTPHQARANMERLTGASLPFELTFWDITLDAEPDAPDLIERRCQVAWAGDHTRTAISALRDKMAEPPVFGTVIALPATHQPVKGTALIEGRELLRGRVAVVHVGTRNGAQGIETFMAVDRLPADWKARTDG